MPPRNVTTQIVVAAIGAFTGCASAPPVVAPPTVAPKDVAGKTVPSFPVTSILVKEGQTMPDNTLLKGFGCKGENVSPDLSWSGEPAETKSFAVITYDPDAPTGVGFFHWTVSNIPATVHTLEAGAGGQHAANLPEGAVVGYSDMGVSEYVGACPPPGDKPHRYQFTVYALDVPKLDTGANTTGAMLRFMLREHTVAQGTLTATYGR